MEPNISAHITYLEGTASPTALRRGIKNEPNAEQLANMKLVAEKCFEPIRRWYGKPLHVNSFYRSPELNKAVGGAQDKNGNPTSQHCKGMAIDLSAGTKADNQKLFDWAKANLDFDQLIWEFSGVWIHISYNPKKNRKQVFNIG